MKYKTTKSHDIEMNKDDVAYVHLPNFNEKGKIKKQIHLHELIQNYKGADVIFDISEDGTVIGIEILA